MIRRESSILSIIIIHYRKEKNRESARLSRKRKKQYQQLLDNKVAEVLTELEREKTSRLETIQSSYQNLVHECGEAATQNVTVFGMSDY